MKFAKLDVSDDAAVARFIIDNTKPLHPPLVPEIILRLAEESMPIWQKTEDDLGELNIAPPFWAFAWAGGQALARYIIDHPKICRDRQVLDLGAGSGLVAIAACLIGARTVTAADIDKLALAACRVNADANGVSFATVGDDLLARPPCHSEVVLVGDLFYERATADRVSAYIELAKASGSEVYIGDPQRSYFPRDRYRQVAEFAVPVTRDLEDAEIKRAAVWQA